MTAELSARAMSMLSDEQLLLLRVEMMTAPDSQPATVGELRILREEIDESNERELRVVTQVPGVLGSACAAWRRLPVQVLAGGANERGAQVPA
jgi:hypothetical protein